MVSWHALKGHSCQLLLRFIVLALSAGNVVVGDLSHFTSVAVGLLVLPMGIHRVPMFSRWVKGSRLLSQCEGQKV